MAQIELDLGDWVSELARLRNTSWFGKALHVGQDDKGYYVSPHDADLEWLTVLRLPNKAAAESVRVLTAGPA